MTPSQSLSITAIFPNTLIVAEVTVWYSPRKHSRRSPGGDDELVDLRVLKMTRDESTDQMIDQDEFKYNLEAPPTFLLISHAFAQDFDYEKVWVTWKWQI